MKLTWSLRRSAEELYERGLPEPGPVAALQDQRGENDGWEGLVPGCGARAVQQLLRALQVGRCAASLRRWIRARRNDMSHPIPCPFLLTWASAPRFACHATHLLVPVLMGLKRGIPALYPLRTYHTTGPRPPLATCPPSSVAPDPENLFTCRTTGNLRPGGVPINPLPLPAAPVDASAFQQDSSLLAQGFPLRTFDARNLLVGAQMQPLAAYQQLRLLGLQNALSLSFAPQLVPDAIPNALHGAAGMAAGPGMGMMNPAAGMPGRAGWDVQLPMPVPLHGGSAAPQQAAQAVQAAQGGVGRKQEGAAGQKQAPEREEDGDEEERASKRAKGGP
jgi:hypothetical protein